MSKVSQILPVFVFAVIIGAVTSEECLSKTQTWGVVDNPFVFCYCDPTTNTTATVECPEGRGYVNNGTAVGCIPWGDWSDNCITKVDASTISCEGDYVKRPFASPKNPVTFFYCPSSGVAPVQGSCKPGTGFYDRDLYCGCYPFPMWRNITGCVNTA